MNIKPLVGAALAGMTIDLVGNAIQPGPTKDADLLSTKNLVQYGVVGGAAAAVGFLAPSVVGATSSAGGALRGAGLGASALAGWAIGEVVSRQLGW